MKISNAAFANDIFSLTMENIDLHFIIHHESFSQIRDRDLKGFHSHVYFEILYSLDDHNTLFLKNSNIPLKKNSFAVIPPYLDHKASFDQSPNLFSIGFYYEKKQCKYTKNDYASLFHTVFSKKNNIGILDEALRQLFLELQKFHAHHTPVSDGLMLGILVQIIFRIFEKLNDNTDKDACLNLPDEKRKPYSPQGSSFPVLYQVNEVLNARYTENITPESLSEQFFICPKQINRYIFKQYGQTFLQRRKALRMNAAQKLLSETDHPIAEICMAVGYDSINSFYSAFKSYCGVTPNTYRNCHQKKEAQNDPPT